MNIPFKPPVRTIGDLLRRLGDIPPDRVRFSPIPGTATIDDLLRSENRGCELIEGTLVEKPMGWEESLLGGWVYVVEYFGVAVFLVYWVCKSREMKVSRTETPPGLGEAEARAVGPGGGGHPGTTEAR